MVKIMTRKKQTLWLQKVLPVRLPRSEKQALKQLREIMTELTVQINFWTRTNSLFVLYLLSILLNLQHIMANFMYMEGDEFLDLLKMLSSLTTSPSWSVRHGSMLTLSSLAMYNPSMICNSPIFPSLVDSLKNALKDDKFPVRGIATRTTGRILIYQVQNESNSKTSLELLQLLVLALQDESRRRSLSSIKAIAKVNPAAISANLSILDIGPGDCRASKGWKYPSSTCCRALCSSRI